MKTAREAPAPLINLKIGDRSALGDERRRIGRRAVEIPAHAEHQVMKHITCIEDLRLLHKRRVPKAFFDYADRGSYAEETLRANREDFQQIKLRQRILVDISKRDMKDTNSPPRCRKPMPST